MNVWIDTIEVKILNCTFFDSRLLDLFFFINQLKMRVLLDLDFLRFDKVGIFSTSSSLLLNLIIFQIVPGSGFVCPLSIEVLDIDLLGKFLFEKLLLLQILRFQF